jgi:hypothetical protein
LDLYTVKLVCDGSGNITLYGLELITEQYDSTHNIHIPSGIEVIRGQEVTFPAKVGANALNYKGSTDNGGDLYSGTKGGRIAWFRKADDNGQGIYVSKVTTIEEQNQAATVADNGGSNDGLTGLTDSSNSQGNLVRIKDGTSTDRLLLVPTAAPSSTTLTFGNNYAGSASTTALTASTSQFRDDGTTASALVNAESATIELYGKLWANADHSNEEECDEFHWREHGAGLSTDLSTLPSDGSSSERSFTLDNGRSTVKGTGVYSNIVYGGGMVGAVTCSGTLAITFHGSGIDVQFGTTVSYGAGVRNFYLDGVFIGQYTFASANNIITLKIASDLPVGDHVLTYEYVSGGNQGGIISFKVYQPKTPILTGYAPFSICNLMADQILTNLPVNYTTFAIDQGSLRVMNRREFIYSGSGTWSTNGNALFPSGHYTSLAIGTSGQVDLTVFGSDKFRIFSYSASASDTYNVIVDGGTIGTFNGVVDYRGWVYSGATLGTTGEHTIRFQRQTFSNGGVFFGCIDYHTPTFEPSTWNTNPYLDYLIGSNSLGDYTRSAPFDESNPPREYYVESTVADSTGLTTSDLLLARLVLDKGVWEVTIQNNILMQLGNNASNHNYHRGLTLDGTSVMRHATRILYSDRRRDSSTITLPITKRSSLNFVLSADGAGTYNYEYINTAYANMRANIIARKISNQE